MTDISLTIMNNFTLGDVKFHLPSTSPVADTIQVLSCCRLNPSEMFVIGRNILVSSANFKILLDSPMSRSLMKIRNRTGPSTEPCGTPLHTNSWSTISTIDDVAGPYWVKSLEALLSILCMSTSEHLCFPRIRSLNGQSAA